MLSLEKAYMSEQYLIVTSTPIRRCECLKGHNYGPNPCRTCGKIHKHPFKGKPHSQEWGNNISKGRMGIKTSDETKKKLSIALKKAYSSGKRVSWNKGFTKENHPSIAKIANSNIGHITWNKGKTGIQKAKIYEKEMKNGL